jgi:peptidoglycan biosynthesis protein MviN/MurJ (putative lipid II flippase)
MSTSSPQRQLPTGRRLAAGLAAILLLAGGFVGALKAPGGFGLIGYGVSAVAAGTVGFALYLATRRNRGQPSTQTTALAAGLFVLLALVDIIMIVSALMLRAPAGMQQIRFGVLLVTVLLALIIGGIGIFGVARPPRTRADATAWAARRSDDR